jgi:Ulp1 family protease
MTVWLKEMVCYMEILQGYELFMITWFLENKESEIQVNISQQTNRFDCGIFLLMLLLLL